MKAKTTVGRNRLANVGNKFQGTAKRVLCLCSAGMLRSPTLAHVLYAEYGYNTRAAGVAHDYALVPVDEVLLSWADEVVCVEPEVMSFLLDQYGEWLRHNCNATLVTLNVPDEYNYDAPELRAELLAQYKLNSA